MHNRQNLDNLSSIFFFLMHRENCLMPLCTMGNQLLHWAMVYKVENQALLFEEKKSINYRKMGWVKVRVKLKNVPLRFSRKRSPERTIQSRATTDIYLFLSSILP